MNVNEEDILELRQAGGKVRTPKGDFPKPVKAPEQTHVRDETVKELLGAINKLPGFIQAALKAMAERDVNVTVKAPEVSVTPKINVSPQITIESPKLWHIEITERDDLKRIKSMTIQAIEQPKE